LAASSVWVGGLLTILIGLILVSGGTSSERREVYASAIPRFSTLAIISVVVLTLTGLYAAWLQVGNLTALNTTDYGRTLTVKLVLIVPLLLLGAVNLLVIGPRMRAAART